MNPEVEGAWKDIDAGGGGYFPALCALCDMAEESGDPLHGGLSTMRFWNLSPAAIHYSGHILYAWGFWGILNGPRGLAHFRVPRPRWLTIRGGILCTEELGAGYETLWAFASRRGAVLALAEALSRPSPYMQGTAD
jgi:hypothetical protein